MTMGDGDQDTHQREPAPSSALARQEQPTGDARLLLHSDTKRRSVALAPAKGKRWQPPEGLTPADVQAVIDAAAEGRDRLLLRCLWATGGRVSEVLALRPADIRADSLVLPNRKNPSLPIKRVFLPTGSLDLPGQLLLWQKQQGLRDIDPLFCSRKRAALTPAGRPCSRQAISRVQAWKIVKEASTRADVQVLALRPSRHGDAGAPAPVHPHLFRHARVRQLVRQIKSLPLAQKQAGWSRLQMAYLTIGDDEARELMRGVTE